LKSKIQVSKENNIPVGIFIKSRALRGVPIVEDLFLQGMNFYLEFQPIFGFH